MSNGDLIVCGVSEDKLVEDIGLMVPKGDAVPVPAILANKSKDLWRLISQGVIFRLNENSLLRVRARVMPDQPPTERGNDRDRFEAEVERLREENDDLVNENGKLFSLNVSLQEEVKRLRSVVATQQSTLETQQTALSARQGHDSKLDAILELVKTQQAGVTYQKGSVSVPRIAVADVDDSAPLFIPSQIKSDHQEEGRVSLKEEASDASTLTDASKALKGMRKKTPQ